MGHQHHWRLEPPEGRLYFNKTFDERYGDEEDLATNAYLTSPEELQRLRCLLANDPAFENSPSWPKLTEWCSSCTKTRLVKVVLHSEEEKVQKQKDDKEEEIIAKEEVVTVCKVEEEDSSCDARAKDAFTQTPQRRRKGGRGSRMRRLLAFKLMLTDKKGLPLFRLLTLRKTDARCSKREEFVRVQEESASPQLQRKSMKVVEVEEKEAKVNSVDLRKEEERCPSLGASTGDTPIFTPRSFHPDVAVPTPNHFQQLPAVPSSDPSSTSFLWFPTPSFTTFYSSPPYGLMPGPQWMICGTCQSWGCVSVS